MSDTREAILCRLVEIIGGIEGIVAVYRNQPNPNEGKLPAVVIFDADEEVAALPDPNRRRPANADQVITMRPEIIIALSSRAAEAGSRLNELRALIYRAIAFDGPLADLCGPNGRIHFLAARTQFAAGRSLVGEMKLDFAFTYVLRASDLD